MQDAFENVRAEGQPRKKDICLLMIDAEGEARFEFVEWVEEVDLKYREVRLDHRTGFIWNIPGRTPLKTFDERMDTMLCTKVPGSTNMGGVTERVTCLDWALTAKSVFDAAVYNGLCNQACNACEESNIDRP